MLLSRPLPPRFQLPATVVLTDDGRDTVWIVAPDGKSVLRRPVTVAERNPDRVTITEGLAAGDRVVTAGVHSLREGQAVRLTDKTS